MPSARKWDVGTKWGLGMWSHQRKGCPQRGGGEWGSERSPRSHFESRRNKGPRQRSVVPAQPPCAPHLLNAQEPDVLPHDLLRGELEEEDRGEGCRWVQGWKGKPGICGTLGPGEGMDKGTLPAPFPSVVNWGPHGRPNTEMVCPWDYCEDWVIAGLVSPAQCLVRS